MTSPTSWNNIVADLPEAPPPVLASRHRSADRTGGSRAAVSDVPDRAGSQPRTQHRNPRAGAATSCVSGDHRRCIGPRRLERALDTPARIYYKYEGVSPAGSHKPNTAVVQAFYNKEAGIKRLTTRNRRGTVGFGTGAGGGHVRPGGRRVHGARELRPETVPAGIHGELRRDPAPASPSDKTASGRAILAEHPDSTGSLGIAISGGSRDRGPARRHQLRPGQRAQPRAAAPDRHRARKRCVSSSWPTIIRTW